MERNARDKYITVLNAVAPRMDKKTLLMSFNSFCLDCPNKNVTHTHTHTHTLYPSIHVLYIDKVKRLIDFFCNGGCTGGVSMAFYMGRQLWRKLLLFSRTCNREKRQYSFTENF